jgi:neogenin
MELKAIEKSQSNTDGASSSGAMTLPRSVGGNEYDTHEGIHTNSLDQRTYVPNYMGEFVFGKYCMFEFLI